MEITPALHRLLEDGARFDAEYGDGLSNHLPMALIALERLGAEEDQLRAWAVHYAPRLRPARARESWPAGDAWASRFGERGAWPMYRDLFRQWIRHEGAREVLTQVLPQLMPGCGAAAFHGLIRTSYAAQVGHLGELADGLAHWAASFLPLGTLPEVAARESDPATLLRRLRAGSSDAWLITGRMADAAADGAVNRAIAPLVIDAGTPERLARAAAYAYAESGNFTALHLVTGAHAARVLMRFVDDDADRSSAWRWFWQAFAHGVVAARLAPAPAVPLRPWRDIVAAALESDDEHVIKLVDSAREHERFHVLAGVQDDLWRRAASRAVAAAFDAAAE